MLNTKCACVCTGGGGREGGREGGRGGGGREGGREGGSLVIQYNPATESVC